jgi:hypothetical protein
MSVVLVGPYHGDSYGGGGTHTKACGWPGLKIGRIIPERAAPFRIDDDEGPIGWAPASSLLLRCTGTIRVGLSVVVE